MTQYNTLNLILSISQLNKLKSGTKNITELALKLLPNVSGYSNDENNFLHSAFSAFSTRLPKAFAKISSANIKLSKTQLEKIDNKKNFQIDS